MPTSAENTLDSRTSRWAAKYVVPIAGTFAAAAIRWVLGLYIDEVPPFITFYPVVLLSAVAGGAEAGVVATALSTFLVLVLFLAPGADFRELSPGEAVGLTLFCGINLVISALGSRLRDARLRAEEEARRSEATAGELEELLHLLDLATVMVRDLHDRITRWSTGCQRLYGYSAGQALGQVTHELLKTQSDEPLSSIHDKLIRRGRWEGELRHTTADGREIAVASEWVLWYDATGKPAAILEANTDITQRRRAEEELRGLHAELEQRVAAQAAEIRHSEERFRLIVEGTEDYAIFMLDPQGRVVSWNPGAERIKGYTSAEIMGRDYSCFYPPDEVQRGRPRQVLERAAAVGRVEDDGWRVRKDGSRFWANAVITALRDPGGGLRGFAKLTRDMTERKEAEDALNRANEMLERRSSELAAANRELEAFTYTVSHDLRAPLRHVTSFVELLNKHAGAGLDEKGRRYLRTIFEAGSRMGSLIDDLLRLSRISRAPMVRRDVDLDGLVEEVRHELAPEMGDRAIDWRIGPLPAVRADPELLRSVMVNLLSNAIKYTRGRDPAKIEIGCRETAGEWVFFVRDNGAGFDMQFADQLFGVFQRLHRMEDFEGTGIGLASVRRIVQRHGGRTWAEGVVDRGATFYFSLPRETASENDEPAQANLAGRG